MPQLNLPPDVPLGVWWYISWISVHAILIYLLRLLADPSGRLKNRADEETKARLPSFNEHLWRLVDESNRNPYKGVLNSVDDLMNLLTRIRNTGKPILRYRCLQRNMWFGFLVSTFAIVVAVICAGIYLVQEPNSGVANLVSIVAFSILTIWSLWYLGKVAYHGFMITRLSDED